MQLESDASSPKWRQFYYSGLVFIFTRKMIRLPRFGYMTPEE